MKSSKFFVQYLILVLTIFSVVGCGMKEDLPEPPVVKLVDPTNNNNPYDNIGRLHNEGLDYITDTYSSEIEGFVNENNISEMEFFIINKAIEFSQSKGYEIFDLPELELLRGEDGRFSSTDYFDFNQITKKGELSDYDQNLMVEYLNQVSSIPLDSNEKINSVISLFKQFENEVLSNEKIDQLEKVLSVLAVGKYSVSYWSNKPARKANWKIILADIGGGIIGGALTGGGGILTGAAAMSSMADKW